MVNHKSQPSAIRELFYEARAELSKDADNLKLKQDAEKIDSAIVCLFCRITTHLRALEVLYQNDLALEADVLLRGCLESVFWLGALTNDPQSLIEMEKHFNFQRQMMAKNLLSDDESMFDLGPELRQLLIEVEAEKKIKFNELLSISKVARRAGISAMYQPFSELSNSAAHASLNSLNRHFVVKPDKSVDYFTALVIDPNWDKVFRWGCCVILFTKNFLNSRFTSPGRQWEDGLLERLRSIRPSGKGLEREISESKAQVPEAHVTEIPTMEEVPEWLKVKLTMYEYLLEVMLANNLAVLDEDRAAQFKSDVLGRPLKLPPRSGPVDVDEIQAFQSLLRGEMENFLRKVSDREANLRDLMARGD